MTSVKKNFIYSSIITVANYVFPLLTFPYVSRVLGVNNIGICNFVDSIIHYFIYISMMGISVVGIREIAASKGDRGHISKTFSSLALINAFATTISVIGLILCINIVPKFAEYKDLLYIGVFKLLGNALLIEWLYKGLEDFKYITKRTLWVKTVYVVSIFIFVRDADDYKIYYLLSMLMITVNALFNVFHSRKFVKFSIRGIELSTYLKPFLVMGVYILITSMYTSFNVLFLGFVTDNVQVGYYTVSHKLHTIVIALFGAFTGVMLPRMSNILSSGDVDGFKQMINKSTDVLFTFAFPVIILLTIYSPQLIEVLSGKGYEGAITPTRLMMPLIFIIGYEQILVHQVLMPLKSDRIIFINSIIGAIIGLSLNLLLVNRYAAVGSSITWLISELSVLLFAQLMVTRHHCIKFPFKRFMKYCAAYSPITIAFVILYNYIAIDSILVLILTTVIMVLYTYIVQIMYLKNQHFLEIAGRIFRLPIR